MKKTGIILRLSGLLLLLSLSPEGTMAQLSGTTDAEKLDFLKDALEKDRKSAVRWQNAWFVGYTAATVGQGIVYFTSSDKATRQDMALGAATTFLGAAGVIVMPVVPHDSYYRHSAGNSDTSSNRGGTEGYYATRLGDIAVREIAGRSWKNHALTGAVNLASGLITWKVFDRTLLDGFVNFALNTVITEAQIWTQPVGAIRDLKKYSSYGPRTSCRFSVSPGMLAFTVDF
jgi:hypothetical protein